MVQPFWKTSLASYYKVKYILSITVSNFTPGYLYPRETETLYKNVNSSSIHKNQKLETTQYPKTGEYVMVCPYNKIAFNNKKRKVLIKTTETNHKIITLRKRSQAQKGTHCVIPFI